MVSLSDMLVSTAGGLGLFLLGMAVMTEGLKALAGSALRRVLAKAAASPVRGTFWGAIVTLLVQSSTATTMTTIGLVSAGLLTFPQGLSLVFGANIGTTGTAWLVALLGVKFSLTAAAMPMVLAGALLRLFGKGRWSALGGSLAGFALLLAGLTMLQGGMGGLAERINPADLPAVMDTASLDLSFLRQAGNAAVLISAGLIMTVLMQSSSAAIAITLSALHAGAIGPDQAVVLVIGQNVGSAVSSAMAAIGATSPAKRTAMGHVTLNVVSASLALLALPVALPFIVSASARIDATLLLAAFNSLYKTGGVALMLPVIDRFARVVERLVPQRGVNFTRRLDRSVLDVPAVAVESARRTIAEVLAAVCESVGPTIARFGGDRPGSPETGPAAPPPSTPWRGQALLLRAEEALDQTRTFVSSVVHPPSTAEERQRLTSALHALDHASRLVDNIRDEPPAMIDEHVADPTWGPASIVAGDRQAARSAGLCANVLQRAGAIAGSVADPDPANGPTAAERSAAVDEMTRLAGQLADLRRTHRAKTLEEAGVVVRPEDAIHRVETVKRLDRLAYHAWRAALHLSGSTMTHPPHEPAHLDIAPDATPPAPANPGAASLGAAQPNVQNAGARNSPADADGRLADAPRASQNPAAPGV